MIKRGPLVSLAALTIGMMAAQPAFARDDAAAAKDATAQDAPAAPDATPTESGKNDDIVVIAQFRETRLQDTPIAITEVNAAMLEARPISRRSPRSHRT